MTITIITATTEPYSGQFICAGVSPSQGFCSGPHKIVRVTDSRIYYRDEEHKRDTFMSRSRALYLCDTAEEGMAMFHLTYEREQARQNAKVAASAKVTQEYAPRMLALMNK